MIATAKHFIGDGGTAKGQDQGVNQSSEADMINIHGQGYYGALGAGAQTVMASFNSWTNADLGITEGKVHGSDKVLNQILKGKIGFDGLVVSDWNGIGQVTGCTNASCPRAINAGLDIIMVPNDWKAAAFVHKAPFTSFELDGKHAQVACASCHGRDVSTR